jgi:hypothetical protein
MEDGGIGPGGAQEGGQGGWKVVSAPCPGSCIQKGGEGGLEGVSA